MQPDESGVQDVQPVERRRRENDHERGVFDRPGPGLVDQRICQ
jgi:hypothetical protein